ncbi:MAG: hypothetical protein A2579_04445 [Lysobacterales bacterium RIFOXYD1_FULL_69_11]|nr:MAG: hypothetical protein A2190_09905 [Xanthomonadales bacterium RIFOXYA1_FULL_69_10]OHE88473.1 MAG: hypothetical protein A2579_04445 [Xanthomonadales bacterium RIFOXYD1_FULL_69_11]
MRALALSLATLLTFGGVAAAAEAPSPTANLTEPASAPRTGLSVLQSFRDGLADPSCEGEVSDRWRRHFASAPSKLSQPGSDVMPLFAYVVDALRASHLPTEYALIPFVESGYKPAARSPAGPAGLWQFIALTARNHKIQVDSAYDGRYSAVDSTRAAVRYLRTLHGMFAGDWRLAAMAYNAGEYRILGALKRNGQVARDARPEALQGIPGITQAYVRKLHALACVVAATADDPARRAALEAPIETLVEVEVPDGIDRLDALAAHGGHDADRLRALNPAFRNGRIAKGRTGPQRLLAPVLVVGASDTPVPASVAAASVPPASAPASTVATAAATATTRATAAATGSEPRRHVVARGENPWVIARRYGMRVADLLSRNGLRPGTVLQPGMALHIDAPPASD